MNNDIICFDTESAQGRIGSRYKEELLEISIMNGGGETIFYHRFKPLTLKKWNKSVHHISPDMVKNEQSIKAYKDTLQRLIDQAKFIVGFSLIDDFKALENAGLRNLRSKPQLELRHLYWYCVARHENIPFYSGPGLSKCAEQLGIKIDTEAVHSASGDTNVTLTLFHRLMHQFLVDEKLIKPFEDINFGSLSSLQIKEYFELAQKRIDEAKYEYDRSCSAGYIHVIADNRGVIFTSSLSEEYSGGNLLMTIKVAARRKAIYELETMFEHRRSKALKKVFLLNDKELKELSEYTNEFDGKEQFYQKLTGLRRAGLNL